MNTMRPTTKELEQKKWYRLWKALTWVLIILAFIAPWFIKEPNPWLIIDGMISSAIWAIISFALRDITLYVVYGKKDSVEKAKNKEKIRNIFGI